VLYFCIPEESYAYSLHNLEKSLTLNYYFLTPRTDKSNKKRRARAWKSRMLPPYSRIRGPEEEKRAGCWGGGVSGPTHTNTFHAGTKAPNVNRAKERRKSKAKVRQKNKKGNSWADGR
jgi:hypothetical protein